MEREWIRLCGCYGLGELRRASPLRAGTSARVWRLETARGVFLARTLSDEAQGELEWSIYRHLSARGFDQIPALILTTEGSPSLEICGTWYQVQEFVEGTMPDPAAPGAARSIARTVKGLTSALAGCPPIAGSGPPELAELWERGRPFWSLLELPLSPAQADREIARCLELPEEDRQVIHGDLGLWNMLRRADGSIVVIDLGAARMGDPCFDFATAFGGLINHTDPEQRVGLCREFLDELACDRARLMGQLRLWAWRGLAEWAILAGQGTPAAKMAARFCNALQWAEGHNDEL